MSVEQRDAPAIGRFGAADVGTAPPHVELPPEEPAKRRKRWPWVTAAVTVIVLVAGAFLLGHQLGRPAQVEVWQLKRDIPAGAKVAPTDLQPVRVSKAAAAQAAPAILPLPGVITRDTLRAGSLLPTHLLPSGTPLPGRGQVLLGVAASPGSVPDGLAAGDVVTVLKLPVTTSSGSKQPDLNAPAITLLSGIEVYSVSAAGSGSVVTLVVPTRYAVTLTALGAQNRISLTQTR